MRPRRPPRLAVLLPLSTAFVLAACERAGLDETTIDETAPTTASAPQATVTLPSAATIQTSPQMAALDAYLGSGEAAGRRFPLPQIRFQDGEVRQDPDTTLTSLAAVLNAHPAANIRIEAAPGAEASARADALAEAIVESGVSRARVASGAAAPDSPESGEVWLVVVAK